MKKILSSILILVFCIYITGCKNNNKYIVLHTETYEVQYEIYENGCSKYNLGFSEESYYVIDNYDDYLMFCSSALAMKINPNMDELNKFFDEFVILCYARTVSYSKEFIPVEYRYIESTNKIKYFYINESSEENYPCVEVAYCFDMVDLPKDIYEKNFKDQENNNLNFNHTEHTAVWYRTEIGHIKTYTCGCPSEEGSVSHIDIIEDGFCDECNYNLTSKESDIQLNKKSLFIGSYSQSADAAKEFFSEYGLSSKGYLIIDNYEYYKEVISQINGIFVSLNEENKSLFFDEKYANTYFDNFIIVLHLRYISGSHLLSDVDYYYNLTNPKIKIEYPNNLSGSNILQVFLGYGIDIIEIPKEYYNELTK